MSIFSIRQNAIHDPSDPQPGMPEYGRSGAAHVPTFQDSVEEVYDLLQKGKVGENGKVTLDELKSYAESVRGQDLKTDMALSAFTAPVNAEERNNLDTAGPGNDNFLRPDDDPDGVFSELDFYAFLPKTID